MVLLDNFSSLFFFNDTATTEIYTLSLHDALPISSPVGQTAAIWSVVVPGRTSSIRSEEHTSVLQSRSDLVCRLLLEKKNTTSPRNTEGLRGVREVHARHIGVVH